MEEEPKSRLLLRRGLARYLVHRQGRVVEYRYRLEPTHPARGEASGGARALPSESVTISGPEPASPTGRDSASGTVGPAHSPVSNLPTSSPNTELEPARESQDRADPVCAYRGRLSAVPQGSGYSDVAMGISDLSDAGTDAESAVPPSPPGGAERTTSSYDPDESGNSRELSDTDSDQGTNEPVEERLVYVRPMQHGERCIPSGAQIYECPCNESFLHMPKAVEHVKRTHGEVLMFSCDVCGEVREGFSGARIHRGFCSRKEAPLPIIPRPGAPGPPTFPCGVCNRVFKTVRGRGQHARHAHPNFANERRIHAIQYEIERKRLTREDQRETHGRGREERGLWSLENTRRLLELTVRHRHAPAKTRNVAIARDLPGSFTARQVKEKRRHMPGGRRDKGIPAYTEIAASLAPNVPEDISRLAAATKTGQSGSNTPIWPALDWERLLMLERKYFIGTPEDVIARIAAGMRRYSRPQIEAKLRDVRNVVEAPDKRTPTSLGDGSREIPPAPTPAGRIEAEDPGPPAPALVDVAPEIPLAPVLEEENPERPIPTIGVADQEDPPTSDLPVILPPVRVRVRLENEAAGLTVANFAEAVHDDTGEFATSTSRALRDLAVKDLPVNSGEIVEEMTKYVVTFLKTLSVEKAKSKSGTPAVHSVARARKWKPMRAARSIRRVLAYKKTQALWKSDRKRLARLILDGKKPERCGISIDEVEEVYQGRFGAISCEVDLSKYPKPQPANNDGLLVPISEKEVLDASKTMRKGTAAGPDGVTLKAVQTADRFGKARANLFNTWLLTGKVPTDLKQNRSILLPKTGDLTEIGNWRPLTIASVLLRQYTAILSARLTRAVHLNPRQRGFIKAQGCVENTSLVQLALKFSKKWNKPISIAFLDLAKAFDTVSHHHIVRGLERFGVHPHLVGIVVDLYSNTGTRFEVGGKQTGYIAITQGVKQGDPLSPLLFNIALDPLFDLIEKEGEAFHFSPVVSLGSVAYADDNATLAPTAKGLQKNLNITGEFCVETHLTINVRKSEGFTLLPAGKTFLVNAHTETLTIGDEVLPLVEPKDSSKYLGSRVSPWTGKVAYVPVTKLKEWIENISVANLKPRQRLILLVTYAIPRLCYALTVGTPSLAVLKHLDLLIRGAVKKWLKLPLTASTAYLYLSARDGGLGLPQLKKEILVGVLRGLVALTKSKDQTIVKIAAVCNVSHQIGAIQASLDVESLNQAKKWRSWCRGDFAKQISNGVGAECYSCCPISNHWLSHNTFMKDSEFISAVKLRAGCYPVRSVLFRGEGERGNRGCRRCSYENETPAHVSGWCGAVKSARIKRHNKVVKWLCTAIKRVGWQVLNEPVIPDPDGNRLKPDLLVYDTRQKHAIIIDPTVVWDSSLEKLDTAFNGKIRKYTPLVPKIKRVFGVETVQVFGLVIGARGSWCKRNDEAIAALHLLNVSNLKQNLCTLTLCGTAMVFRCHGKG
jgi:hypothetical protein